MLKITPNHKIIKNYYQELQAFERANQTQEDTVKQAFQHILEAYAQSRNWTLIQEQTLQAIRLDGTLFDESQIPRGYWEAKRESVKLEPAIQEKLYGKGYPQDNIVFQKPSHAILIQNGEVVLDVPLAKPENLLAVVEQFFDFKRPEYDAWDKAAIEFKERVPELGARLLAVIRTALQKDKPFNKAFNSFAEQCRQAINPNLADAAIEEMLIQHLLTERIFRNLFSYSEFAKRNIIAREIEVVIEKLTAKSFNRDAFFAELQYFYKALEGVAATISEYSYKQHFLNTIYERFFQGFSVKVADTHGIVYTPQPIVDFMVRSVEEILQQDFGKSLADKGVHILDPFVGTGNFISRVIRALGSHGKMKLDYKYKNELHCNEIMLLPYYLACMNIEHQYMDVMGRYLPFEGICLADTFELVEDKQPDLFAPENTERVEKQKATDFFVIIGNPPYNASQNNENDNNKNQVYKTVGNWVKETYAKDSKATLKNSLSDPYVKAIKWASERIKDEGIVAFVTNNSFLDSIAFDGMRKHLAQDFSKIYHINLKGNARTSGERRRQEGGNVFDDSIRVSVGITFFIKSKQLANKNAEIWLYSIDDYLKAHDKKNFLDSAKSYSGIPMQLVCADKKHIWLTEGLHEEFDKFVPLGTKETKATKKEVEGVVFKIFSNGVKTNSDAYLYNFDSAKLVEIVQGMVENYGSEQNRWIHKGQPKEIEGFLNIDERVLKWIRYTKRSLLRGKEVVFNEEKIRHSLYRPFTKRFYYFERIFNEDVYNFPKIFPTPETEAENRVIYCTNHSQIPFVVQITDCIPDLCIGGRNGQAFPFYTYNEDGSNRTENITDWALNHWQQHYQDKKITKWDIFHYVYSLLHQPQYREKYAQNLKRELPRLPLTPTFWDFAQAGQKLAELHLNYEQIQPYQLAQIENPKYPFSLKVEKMRLSKDKTQLIYNNFLTLTGIPKPAFDYKLGNRSALEWIIDQYRIKTDKRSGIVNNPNRKDDEEYILQLVGKVVAVSLETVGIVLKLKELEL